MFNADAYRAAMAPPSITLDGELLTGKILSQDAMLKYEGEWAKWTKDILPEDEARAFLTDFLTALGFPAERLLTSLPVPALQEALLDFFACQYRRLPKPAALAPEPSPNASAATPS